MQFSGTARHDDDVGHAFQRLIYGHDLPAGALCLSQRDIVDENGVNLLLRR